MAGNGGLQMREHRIKVTLDQDSKLVLEALPFLAGDTVEVIILESDTKSKEDNPYPLRGTVIKYVSPTDPVNSEEWDASSDQDGQFLS
jgi:hypothetical protein